MNSKLDEGDTIFMDLDKKDDKLIIKIERGDKPVESKTETKE